MISCIWLKAIISPIPKDCKAHPHFPLNSRGISLLCGSAKLYIYFVNNLIDCIMRDKLVDVQNVFHKDRSGTASRPYICTSLLEIDFMKT